METDMILAVAATTVSLLAPYLQSAGQELAKKAGGAAWDKTKQLYDLAKRNLSKYSGQAQEIDELAKSPNNQEKWIRFRRGLEAAMVFDPDFADELARRLKDALDAGAAKYFSVTVSGNVGNIIQNSTVYGGLGNTNITNMTYETPEEKKTIFGQLAKIGDNVPVWDDPAMRHRELGVLSAGTKIMLTGREGRAWTGAKTVEFNLVKESESNWTFKRAQERVTTAWTVWETIVSEENPHPKMRFGWMTDKFGFQWEVVWTFDNLVQATNMTSHAKKILGRAETDAEADEIYEDYKLGWKDITGL